MSAPKLSKDVQAKLDEAKAIQDATAWRPEAGHTLTGTLIAIKKGESKWGAYPLAIFQTETGEYLAFHAFHGVPRSRLIEAKPEIGDKVSIRYDGKVDPKNEGEDPMNMYTIVVHDKPAAVVGWDTFA